MLHKNKNEGHIEEIISEGGERRRVCVCVKEREGESVCVKEREE